MMDWIAFEVVAMFALIQYGAWKTAFGENGEVFIIMTLLVSPAMLVIVGLYLLRIQSMIREAEA